MNISTQFTVSIKPESLKSQLNKNTYKPGSTIRLKVIELRGDRALIDFGAFRATADIKIPVTLGDELQVKVLESGKQLKLGVINVEPKNPLSIDRMMNRLETLRDENFKKVTTDLRQILRQAMESPTGKSAPQSIINILNNLNAHFESIDLTEAITKLIPRLKSFLENSGLFFEKRLENVILKSQGNSESEPQKSLVDLAEVKHIVARDPKANLMGLKFIMEDREALQKFLTPRALTTLNKAINSLLTDITQQQGRAVGQLDSAEPFQVFTYLLPLKDGDRTARLKVYYQKKQNSGVQKEFRISVLLSMDRLGDLRTDFFLLDKDLTITFFVKEDSVKVKIQQNFLELQELLQGFFGHIRLKVMVSEKKVREFNHEDLQVSGDRRVDLRI